MHNLISTFKKNRYIQIALTLSMIVVIAFILFGTNDTTSAQEGFAGQKWEHLELNFNTPVTFGDTVAAGYFQNGDFVQPNNPDTLVRAIINSVGNKGWELVTVNNNQIFIFKRPVQ